jgi:hypothetical protein
MYFFNILQFVFNKICIFFNPFAVIIPCQLCWLELVMDHGT